ncbi:MAG TPA: T9SS type A sorting domain-containing protein [Bacteroidia bacterium]
MKTNLFIIKIMIACLGVIIPAKLSATFTAVVPGDWTDPVTWGGIAPPLLVSNEDVVIPEGMTVNLDADVVFAGGSSSMTIDGTLSNTTFNGVTVVSGELAGDGTIAIWWIHFKQLASFSFSGMVNVRSLVNEVPVLSIGNDLNIIDTLDLKSGVLELADSCILTLRAGSTWKVDDGIISIAGGELNQGYLHNVMYVGTSKTTSIELSINTLKHLFIKMDDGNTLTLNDSATTVNGSLVMTSGNLYLNGKELKIRNSISQTPTSRIRGHINSDLYLNLTSVSNDTIYFENTGAGNHSLNKLRIGISDSNALVLGSELIIGSVLEFAAGKLALANNDLIISSSASVSGYNDSAYIVTSQDGAGNLVMNVSTGSPYTTFPVGTFSGYSPVYIQQTASGTSGNFSARVRNSVLENGTSGTVSSEISKVVDRTWFLNSTTSTVDANIKLGWQQAAEVNGFDRENAYISNYGTSWDQVAPGSSAGGDFNTFELTRSGIIDLGPFAVIDSWQVIKLNEINPEAAFTIYPNPARDVVSIKMPDSDDYKYELVDLTGKILLSESSKGFNKFNLTDLESGCYFVKVTNLSSNATVTKRIIKE